MSSPYAPPPWVEDALALITRLEVSGVTIRSLKLTSSQYDELEAYFCEPPYALYGYSVVRA